MEYKAVFIDGVLHMIPVTVNSEIVDGIKLREVKKAKGV
jgi:hypothetical protein